MTMPCGCKINFSEYEDKETGDMLIDNGEIEFCPLHAHAEELLKQVKEDHDQISCEWDDGHQCGERLDCSRCVLILKASAETQGDPKP